MKQKKILCLVLCIVLIIAISACAKVEDPLTNIPNTNVMMEVTSSFVGKNSDGKDGAIVNQWTLYYDGLLDCKSEATGGISVNKSISVSKDDFNKIKSILEAEKNASDDATIIDGISWDLKYFDQEGNALSKYDGYLYNGNGYEQLYKILKEYMKD